MENATVPNRGLVSACEYRCSAMRGDRPFVFTNLKTGQGLDEVIAWIERELLFDR